MIDTAAPQISFKDLLGQELANKQPAKIKDIAFKSPIIIGGCGSSGTTLLKTMLDSHKNIACGQEISFFDRPAFFKSNLDKLYNMFLNQDFDELDKGQIFPLKTKFGDNFGLFIPNTGKLYHDFPTTNSMFKLARNLRHFVDLYFSNFADINGKTRWAEKTPNNIFCINETLDFFPDAKFIHVIRDGRDVVLSLCQGRNFNPVTAIFRWLVSAEAGIRFRGNPRYYEVRYEDLILDTENTLKKLMAFLDEDFDPNMLNYTESGKDNILGYGSSPIYSNKIGKWKTQELNPVILKSFDLALSDLLEKVGYEV
ncbi:MAG: sulfotransferase [candidate division Zixibacteria bacterium]|nr:sulfotransferase [candidate division Zixibacteria bacterium]